jgi:8-oxo-dGTP diphosphatase
LTGDADSRLDGQSASGSQRRRVPGHGAVAIVVEDGQFLVIRRSHKVRAPNLLCFAGGTIEPGESPEIAIVRELNEELSLKATAIQHVWQSRTSWGTLLEWILVERHTHSQPVANLDEVAEWMWLHPEALLNHPELLPSVPAFFRAWSEGEFGLPSRAGKPDLEWRHL